MASELKMPQLSDTMSEGTLVKWNKQEGDKVRAGEEIAEIETDKATMPMESPATGTLALVAIPQGGKAKVGSLIAVIAADGEDVATIKAKFSAGAAASAKAAAGGSPDPATAVAVLDTPGTAGATTPPAGPAGTSRTGGNGSRLLSSPLARRIASEHGINLHDVTGTGPGGRVVQRDVEAFLEQRKSAKPAAAVAPPADATAKPAPLPAPTVSGQTQVVPMTKMRSAIAAALQRSKQTVPHFYETIDIDVEAVLRLREKLNARLEKEQVRISIADFVSKAVASTLLAHPALNARYNAEKHEITRFGDVNLGLAVAIPDGLIVPVLRGVNHMGLKEIRVRTIDLTERARAQRLKREEQSEATFSISSLGTYGIREFSAIINPPEVGILAVGAAERRAVVRDGAIVARTMMTVTLSCDHRVVDGATAAEFMRTLKETLEEPGMLLV